MKHLDFPKLERLQKIIEDARTAYISCVGYPEATVQVAEYLYITIDTDFSLGINVELNLLYCEGGDVEVTIATVYSPAEELTDEVYNTIQEELLQKYKSFVEKVS